MEGERKKEEDESPQENLDLKKEALLLSTSLKKGWQYVLAYFTGQTMRLKARNEKEASEADLQKAKMQVEATDEAERSRNELNRRSEDFELKDCNIPPAMRISLPPTTTSVHVTALDGLVNVNSLFTVAVFVGLSLTSPGQRSLENNTACDAGPDVVRNLLVFEVVSFSFFLFSSLIAQGLKLAINLLNSNDVDEAFRAHINSRVLRLGMLGSAIGSVMGCLFLLLSMVNVIQIRLGMLSCGSTAAVRAVATLLSLVCTALAFYISTIFYAFTH